MDDLVFTFYGGGWGSKAGDCMLLTFDSVAAIVDLGAGKDIWQECEGDLKARAPRSVSVLITHFHDDHICRGSIWPQVCARASEIWHGPALGKTGATRLEDLRAAAKARGKTPLVEVAENDNGRLWFEHTCNSIHLQAYLITSQARVGDSDENCRSLGALFVVRRNNAVALAVLNLGDMEINNADNNVLAAWRKHLGGKEIAQKIVKLSHHGSDSNLLPCLDSIVDDKTILLSSGYSLTSVEGLAAFLKRRGRPSLKFLMHGIKTNVFVGNIGDNNWNRLKTATENLVVTRSYETYVEQAAMDPALLHQDAMDVDALDETALDETALGQSALSGQNKVLLGVTARPRRSTRISAPR